MKRMSNGRIKKIRMDNMLANIEKKSTQIRSISHTLLSYFPHNIDFGFNFRVKHRLILNWMICFVCTKALKEIEIDFGIFSQNPQSYIFIVLSFFVVCSAHFSTYLDKDFERCTLEKLSML